MPHNNLNLLTDYQFAVLSLLHDGEVCGKELRRRLREHDVPLEGPLFYQLVARMKKAGFVQCRMKTAGGETLQDGWYSLTSHGKAAWSTTWEWYSRLAAVTQNKEIPCER